MKDSLTIATWNLSEGRFSRSAALFDYEPGEHLDYFAGELAMLKPDVVCIPETHIPKVSEASLTSRLAKRLGFKHYHERPFHHSLRDDQGSLGLGLISPRAFKAYDVALQQPDFPLVFENGRKATDHTRWLMMADFGKFLVVTTHNWPLKVFQHSYEQEPGARYGRSLERSYLEALPNDKPLVISGDLNFNSVERVMPRLIKQLKLSEALPEDQPTRNQGDHPDHILYGPDFECIEAKIIPGRSEHYLCYAKFRLAEPGAER